MLENILIKYFDLKEDWNDNKEKQKENWNESYNKLIELIYDLDKLGVFPTQQRIVDELDKIYNMEE